VGECASKMHRGSDVVCHTYKAQAAGGS
jgi:hypothetical protein